MNIQLSGKQVNSHNPYFNRWFSAINCAEEYNLDIIESQSLF